MKNIKKVNVINIYAPKLKDTLHADGSKTYETCNYGYLTIKNPELVKLIEVQISIDGFGWFYLDAIQKLVDTKNITDITRDVLLENGLASKNSLIKIMGRGELKSKVNITVHAFTATAKAAIESKGGVATEI